MIANNAILKTYSRSTRPAINPGHLPTEYYSYCRLCLSQKVSIDIFTREDRLLKLKIQNCTGISVSEGDGLPTKLCRKCYKNIINFYDFKENCISSEAKLKQLKSKNAVCEQLLTQCDKYNKINDSLAEQQLTLTNQHFERVLLEEENIHPDAPDDVISQIKQEFTSSFESVLTSNSETFSSTASPPLTCKECDKQFSCLTDLADHHSKDHGWSRVYCALCTKSFLRKAILQRHMRIHTGSKPYSCNECGKRFSQKVSVARHKTIHSDRAYQCDQCPRVLTSTEGLKCHIFTHHTNRTEEELNRYKCKLCSKSFCHSSGLSRHLNCHKGFYSACNDCNKIFQDPSYLNRHKKKKHQH